MNGHERQQETSRQMIETALFELMREKEYKKISISELTARADVARRTFYRLYGSKDEVLELYFRKLYQEYQSNHGKLCFYDIRKVAEEYFIFWHQYREVLLLLHKCGLDEMLVYYIMGHGKEAIVRERIADPELREAEEMRYFAAYSIGGFGNLLYRWILKGMKGNPVQYAEMVSGAILKYYRV